MSKIIELLRDFNAIILCRTLPRMALARSQKNDSSLMESYKFLLQEKAMSLGNNDGMHEHIKDFSMYCASNHIHLTYTDLLKNITAAFCPPGVIQQLGDQRRQQVCRGIFIKIFQESANTLVRTPEILDMAANRSDNNYKPCQKIVENAIETIKMNLFSEEIVGTPTGKTLGTSTTMVTSKMYETLRAKYDSMVSIQGRHEVDMDKAIKKIKELTDAIKKLNIENKALKTRLREIDSIPKEIFVARDTTQKHDEYHSPEESNRNEPPETTALQIVPVDKPQTTNNDFDDDSVSQVGKHKTSGSVVSVGSNTSKTRGFRGAEAKQVTQVTQAKQTKKKTVSIVDDDDAQDAFDPDEFDSFFND